MDDPPDKAPIQALYVPLQDFLQAGVNAYSCLLGTHQKREQWASFGTSAGSSRTTMLHTSYPGIVL